MLGFWRTGVLGGVGAGVGGQGRVGRRRVELPWRQVGLLWTPRARRMGPGAGAVEPGQLGSSARGNSCQSDLR